MPSRAPLRAWIAACAVVVPIVALAQERSAEQIVEAIVREGPRAIAIRATVDVVGREQQARLAFPNPGVAYSRESAGFTEFVQVEQPLPIFGVRGSARDGLLIMVNLPLALIGGVAGVYLADSVLSVASIVGFITLFGIATRNGIMLVSHIKHLQTDEGVTDFRTAVVQGATERVVPILMTAVAAGLALVPIALSAGQPGSEIQVPMAMVIMFGLLSSTALNMVVVPILYERFGRRATVADSRPSTLA